MKHPLKFLCCTLLASPVATFAQVNKPNSESVTPDEEMFRQALAISPANYSWRNTNVIALSRLLIQDQRAKEAVKLFDGMDFSKLENTNARGQLLKASARVFLAAGKKIKAVETFDTLLQSGIPGAWKDRINKELERMAEDF